MAQVDGEELRALREGLVEQLKQAGALISPSVEEAFWAVPRHLFLPGEDPRMAYRDEAVVTKTGADGRPISSSSQPAIMAAMLEQLDLHPGQRVLEIGAGTGYNAAVMSQLVGPSGRVTSIDIDPDVVAAAQVHLDAAGCANVQLVCTDGAFGHPDRAPYDRIIATFGAWEIVPAWNTQLASAGRLVLPLSLRGLQRSVAFVRAGGLLASASIIDCGFMRLRGAMAGPETVTPLGPDGTILLHREADRDLDPEALYQALARPGEAQTGQVRITVGDAFAGLGLWLALHEPDIAGLSATNTGPGATAGGEPAIPSLTSIAGQKFTTAVLGQAGLAVLLRPAGYSKQDTSFPATVQGFGPDGGQLVARLLAHVRDWDRWDRHQRPVHPALQITAHPPEAVEPDPDAVILQKHHGRLALTWR